MRDHARLLSIAAVEAVEEVDTITRRPEVLDTLTTLANTPELPRIMERVAPGVMSDPATEVSQLADALAPYRERPLDDAPELVERLAFIAWVLRHAESDDQPTTDSPTLTLVA